MSQPSPRSIPRIRLSPRLKTMVNKVIPIKRSPAPMDVTKTTGPIREADSKDGKVLNPKSGRMIKIGGPTYNKLLKQKVIS